jgi:mRNA interferase YafQ
MITYRKLIHLS